MRKVLVLMLLFFSAFNLYSQDKFGIYYNSDKLGHSRIGGKKVGNIAGAYFTGGLSSAKSYIVIEGESSCTYINENKPIFDVFIGNDTQTEYIFNNVNNLNNIVLIKLHNKKKTRNLRTGKYGLTGVSTGLDEDDIQPIMVEKITNNHYKIIVRSELEKGEYAFYYIGDVPGDKSKFNAVYDFTIK